MLSKILTGRKYFIYSAGFITVSLSTCYYVSLNATDKRKIQSIFTSGVRFARSFVIGTAIAIDYKITGWKYRNERESADLAWHECHQRAAERILKGCLQNGGIYIKLGQGLVSMNHLFPREYTETLEVLHNQALPRSADEVEQIFREDFHATSSELFQHFEKEPFAAASLAQVHRATTKAGENVAVKVQYIDLRERFHADMLTLQWLLRLVGDIHPDFSFAWVLDEMKDTLIQELDFELEGHNSERCARDLKCFGDSVVIPQVYWPLTSKRVLTAEYFGDACKINDVDSIRHKFGLNLRKVDKALVSVFAHQIFKSGFVHADPHPGNILVTRKRKKRSLLHQVLRYIPGLQSFREGSSDVQLVILDHGLYEYMPPHQRTELTQLFLAILHLREEEIKRRAHNLGVRDWKTFAEIILLRPLHTRGLRLAIKMSEQDRQYMKDMAAQHFDEIMVVLREMPKPMLLFIRNINTVRSICQHHGGLVNRFLLLGEKAIEGYCEDKYSRRRISYWMDLSWRKWQLHCTLKLNSVGMALWRAWIVILHVLGQAPSLAEIDEIIKESQALATNDQLMC